MVEKLITFDVWGTLLKRRCKPGDVKLFTCTALALSYADHLEPQSLVPEKLLAARLAIERELIERSGREGNADYFDIREVLRRLYNSCCLPEHGSRAFVERMGEELAQIELEQERFVSYPAPGVHNLLRQNAGYRLAFVADTSLAGSDIASLLVFHGLKDCAQLGLTTGDVAGDGQAETLFDLLKDRVGIEPSVWVHHGDAARAARLGAGALGLAIRSEETPIGGADTVTSAVPDLVLPRILPDAKGVPGGSFGTETAGVGATAAEMVQIGVEAAPLFAGFALWILEQALKRKSEHIYFFTREGQFFAQVYESVADVYGSGIPSPAYSVLSVSRLSTFAPSLTDLNSTSFSDVWALYTPQSISGLVATLGIERLCDERELAQFGLSVSERIEAPERDSRQAALLSHAPFRDRAMGEIGEMRARLLAYLASMGLDQRSRNVSVVDIGWHGSIQSNIARLLPDTQFHGLYLGLDKRRSQLGPNVTKQAYVVDLERSSRNADLVTYVAPMEFLCSTSFGSTIGYERGTSPEPILMSVDLATQAAFAEVVLPFQAGVLAGVAELAREMRAHALTSEDLLVDAVEVWQRLVHRPTPGMANAFAETTVDETFGFGRRFRLSREAGIVRHNQGYAEGASVTTIVQDTVRSIPWPQAFSHYAQASCVMKYLMPAAVRAAKRGRRLQDQLRGIVSRRQ